MENSNRFLVIALAASAATALVLALSFVSLQGELEDDSVEKSDNSLLQQEKRHDNGNTIETTNENEASLITNEPFSKEERRSSNIADESFPETAISSSKIPACLKNNFTLALSAASMIDIDINVFIANPSNTDNNSTDLIDLFEQVNTYWNDSGISFNPLVITVNSSSDDIYSSPMSFDPVENGFLLGDALAGERFYDGNIDLFVVNNSAIGEISNDIIPVKNSDINVNSILITDSFLQNFDKTKSWYLAHNLGHALGLGDVLSLGNLMLYVEDNHPLREQYVKECTSSGLYQWQLDKISIKKD